MTTTATLIAEIADGTFDEDLDKISEALSRRQSTVRSARTVKDFPIGSSIRFNDFCGTKYLRGSTAQVVGIERTKLLVTLDKPVGRFARVSDGNVYSAQIKVPPSIVDLVP